MGLKLNASATINSKIISISTANSTKPLARLPNANANPLTIFLHMGHTISNVSASTHSRNMIASLNNVPKTSVSNAKALQVLGLVLVGPNSENTKLLFRLTSNGRKKEKLRTIWVECTTS